MQPRTHGKRYDGQAWFPPHAFPDMVVNAHHRATMIHSAAVIHRGFAEGAAARERHGEGWGAAEFAHKIAAAGSLVAGAQSNAPSNVRAVAGQRSTPA